jgi:hypothetical protein
MGSRPASTLSDDDVQQFAEADRREVDPRSKWSWPSGPELGSSIGGEERREWWGRQGTRCRWPATLGQSR